MSRFALSLVGCVAFCGLFTAIAKPPALPESDLERLERNLLEQPAAHYYDVLKATDIIGDAALERRWEDAFEKAEGEDKQGWALLLAMRAAPIYCRGDFPKAKRWLEQAGSGYTAHSYRASVASMKGDFAAVAAHLKAAFDAEPSLKLINQQLFAMERSPDFKLADRLVFLENMWQNKKTPPKAQIATAVQLTQLDRKWLATLEQSFRASPTRAWVEALSLARINLRARRAEEAWRWLENARAADAPAAIYFDELYAFASATGETASAPGLRWLNRIRLNTRPRSGTELIAWVRQSSDDAAANLLKKFADLAVEAPLEWLMLNESGALSDRPALRQTAIEILQAHIAKHANDLKARYILGRLLLIADDKQGSAKVLAAFIEDAIDHVNEPVLGPEERTKRVLLDWSFELRFPVGEDAPAEEQKKAQAQSYPGEYRSAYPSAGYLQLESHIYTIGDLVVRALWWLHEVDGSNFPDAFDDWVNRAHPPFLAQFQLAQKIDEREKRFDLREPERLHLATEITKRHLAQGQARAPDISRILPGSTGDLPTELVQSLLDQWAKERPLEVPRIKQLNLPYLIAAGKFEESKAILAEIKDDPATDGPWLNYVSKSLATAAGDPTLEIPSGEPDPLEMIAQGKEARIARLVAHFKSTADPKSAGSIPLSILTTPGSSFDRMSDLLITPEAKLLPGNRNEVMYSWVMVPIDAALSLFEIEFAYQIDHSNFTELTSDRFAKIAAEVGEDNLSLAMVRAFYDGNPEPDEQFERVAALAAKHPNNELIKMSLAGKALSLGRYQEAFDIASKLTAKDGDARWFAEVVKLICAQETKNTKAAQSAARALIPITYQRANLDWLANQLPSLGMFREQTKLRNRKPYHAR